MCARISAGVFDVSDALNTANAAGALRSGLPPRYAMVATYLFRTTHVVMHR